MIGSGDGLFQLLLNLLFDFAGELGLHLGLLTQPALSLGGLLGQDVAAHRVVPHDFAAAGDLEALLGTSMSLVLMHFAISSLPERSARSRRPSVHQAVNLDLGSAGQVDGRPAHKKPGAQLYHHVVPAPVLGKTTGRLPSPVSCRESDPR